MSFQRKLYLGLMNTHSGWMSNFPVYSLSYVLTSTLHCKHKHSLNLTSCSVKFYLWWHMLQPTWRRLYYYTMFSISAKAMSTQTRFRHHFTCRFTAIMDNRQVWDLLCWHGVTTNCFPLVDCWRGFTAPTNWPPICDVPERGTNPAESNHDMINDKWHTLAHPLCPSTNWFYHTALGWQLTIVRYDYKAYNIELAISYSTAQGIDQCAQTSRNKFSIKP